MHEGRLNMLSGLSSWGMFPIVGWGLEYSLPTSSGKIIGTKNILDFSKIDFHRSLFGSTVLICISASVHTKYFFFPNKYYLSLNLVIMQFKH